MISFKKNISNKIIYLLLLILVILLIPLLAKSKNTIPTTNIILYESWGLGYEDNGEQPTGNVDKNYLEQYNSYYIGDSNEKVLYLTFDAGYENGYTDNILDILKKHDVPAAFFLVGHYLEENPKLIRRMVEEGHLVCNHTMTHPDMSKIAHIDAFKKELKGIEKLYKDIIGEEMPKYYRPPAGAYNENNLQQAKSLGYTTVFWSLAYVDWVNDSQPSREHAFSKLMPRTHPGAVILLHSTSKTNSEILDELITKWKEEGYTFKSIEELQTKTP